MQGAQSWSVVFLLSALKVIVIQICVSLAAQFFYPLLHHVLFLFFYNFFLSIHERTRRKGTRKRERKSDHLNWSSSMDSLQIIKSKWFFLISWLAGKRIHTPIDTKTIERTRKGGDICWIWHWQNMFSIFSSHLAFIFFSSLVALCSLFSLYRVCELAAFTFRPQSSITMGDNSLLFQALTFALASFSLSLFLPETLSSSPFFLAFLFLL